jgi:hypothetical protein
MRALAAPGIINRQNSVRILDDFSAKICLIRFRDTLAVTLAGEAFALAGVETIIKVSPPSRRSPSGTVGRMTPAARAITRKGLLAQLTVSLVPD